MLRLLRSLGDAELSVANVSDFVTVDLARTKVNEDKIDAFIAAYVAVYLWWFGLSRSIVLGSLTEGYIVTPCSPDTRTLVARAFSGYGTNPGGTGCSVRSGISIVPS